MVQATTIAVTNAKGGVGKTFISAHLAYIFATKYSKKTLLIDTDTQGHAAMYCCGRAENAGTIGDLMFGKVSFDDVVVKGETFDLIPSNEFLSQSETMLVSTIAREKLLKRTLQDHGVYDNYEMIIFDTSPSISLINQNVIVASDYYLIPVGLDPLGYAGCISTIEFVNTLKRLIDLRIELLGIIPNMALLTSNISKEMLNLFRSKFGDFCLHSIRQSVRVKEAVSMQKTIFEHESSSPICEDLTLLANDIITRISRGQNNEKI